MEKFVEIPHGVSVDIEGREVAIRGPKGELKRMFDDPRFNRLIKIEKQDSRVIIKSEDDYRKINSMIGTMAAHVRNMIHGVTKGYTYTLKIVTTHFPITVTAAGKDIQIKNFFGEKNARTAKIIGHTGVHIDKDHIEVSGADIESVSQTAANIEQACKLKGRDRRIFQDGIYISRKQSGVTI